MSTPAQRVRRGLLGIDGVIESPGNFTDDDAFWVNGKDIAHFHGKNAIELRLTKAEISARRSELRDDPRFELRRGTSDWITVRYASLRDVALVLELAKIAVAAHCPPAGVPARLPPVGAALERRRRFH